MPEIGVRPATFRDAQAIDRIVATFPPLRQDLDDWVNQADVHAALVAGTEVVGFAARRKHKAHPERDLVSVFVEPGFAGHADALYRAIVGSRPLKLRLPSDDYDAIATSAQHNFVERIRSATYEVVAADLVGGSVAGVEIVEDPRRDVMDAFEVFYANTHLWDPPARLTRRYIRQAMLNGAAHIAVMRDDDTRIIGVGVTHASADDACAADVALVGALDPTRADADYITHALVAHLASFYVEDRRPLWFEVDHGLGTNQPLARLIDRFARPAIDEIVVLTND